MAYLPLGKIMAKVEWDELGRKYQCPKGFDRAIERLLHHGLAYDHGKSGNVASLTSTGVAYAVSLIKSKKYPAELVNL